MLIGALMAYAAPSPQSNDSTAVIKVTTHLVVLDVRVVDRQGRFVANLDRSAFRILEDNVPQAVRNFEGPQNRTAPAVKAAQPVVRSIADISKSWSAPLNVLVIDELNTPFTEISRAQLGLRRFLEKQPAILPVPTLFMATGASHVTVLHDFTQSRDELLASMKAHVSDVDFRALHNVLNGGSMSAQDGFAKTLGTLSQVASSLRGIPGHKNIIWVGTGFDHAYDLTSASQSDEDIIAEAMRTVTQRMLDARISLSTLDPSGIDALAPEENIEGEMLMGGAQSTLSLFQNISFDKLAETTGGSAIHGRNDLAKLIQETTDSANEYYTLTYSPTNRSDDSQAFRHIHIAMRDSSLRAITRTGYFAGEQTKSNTSVEEEQTREFRYDLTSAGGSKLVYTGLHVTGEPEATGYKLLVNASDLQWKETAEASRVAEVSILEVAFDGRDKPLLQQATEMRERIKDTDSVSGTLVPFMLPMNIPPRTARVRFVVRDAVSGNTGSVDFARSQNEDKR
jgi:VWFA-related protein